MMTWRWRVARILGIDVYLHSTFLLLLAGFAVYAVLRGSSTSEALLSLLIFVAVFACVLAHEFGHALMARLHGIKTKEVLLLPVGGVAHLERMPRESSQEFLIAVAGPTVNFVLAGVFFILAWIRADGDSDAIGAVVRGIFSPLEVDDPQMPASIAAYLTLMRVNLTLGVFNLLPGFPMDGGRILRAALSSFMDYTRATRFAAQVGAFIALGIAAFGFLHESVMTVLVALFVFMSGRQEATAAATQQLMKGLRVRSAMTTRYLTLATFDTLEYAATLLLSTPQQDFPVLGDDGRFLGILTRTSLLRELARIGRQARVIDAARRGFDPIGPDDLLEDALGSVSGTAQHSLPVMEEGKLVGLLSPDGIQKALLLREALSGEIPG